MNALRQNKAACAYPAMLLNGVCASSGGVVMALLQERYGLSYQWSGLLLAMLSVGNLAAGFAAGMLPAHWGQRRTVLMLAGGAALGYGAMILTGSPWALLAAFTLVGVAKGTTLNTSSALIAAHARERTKCMNLIHACFATGSLLCPLFIAALGMGGLPWWAPMAGLALCGAALWGVFALAGLPGRTGDGAQKRLVFSAFAPFLGADRACLFPKLHGDQRHGLDGDIFQGCGHPLGSGGPDDRYGHLGCNAGRASVHRICFPGKKQLPHPFSDVRMLRRHLYPASHGKNARICADLPVPVRPGHCRREPDGCRGGECALRRGPRRDASRSGRGRGFNAVYHRRGGAAVRHLGRHAVHGVCADGHDGMRRCAAPQKRYEINVPHRRLKNGGCRRIQNEPPAARAGGALLYSWKERCGVHTLPPCGRGSVPK